jgi:hypothetical protein
VTQKYTKNVTRAARAAIYKSNARKERLLAKRDVTRTRGPHTSYPIHSTARSRVARGLRGRLAGKAGGRRADKVSAGSGPKDFGGLTAGLGVSTPRGFDDFQSPLD